MKMEEGMELNIEELETRKNQKKLSDLVSKQLGGLLLQGFRMLNSTCETCGCILMQKKDQPVYCVQCQDPECQKFHNAHFRSKVVETATEMILEPEPSNNSPDAFFKSNLKEPAKILNNNSYAQTIETLNAKISWATSELKGSRIVTYNIELCQMIKAASEAIAALKIA